MNEDSEYEMRKMREPPQTLQPALQMLRDAHEYWHEAVDGYHEPDAFRRNVEALIQAERNVTWRLQSAKAEIPGFDSWYPTWQALMRADDRLRWLNDARIEVVKRSGLKSESFAIVRTVDSYLEPEILLLRLPAETPTTALLQRARARVGKQYRKHVAIEIARRWSVPEFPGEELTTVLAYCWHVLDALISYASEKYHGEETEEPVDYVSSVLYPPCMTIDPSLQAIMFEADTGEPFATVMESSQADVQWAAAVRRYGLRDPNGVKDDVVAYGQSVHDVARRIMLKDGRHIPLALLRRTDGTWDAFVVSAEDKRDKFVMWHQLGDLVASRLYDAVMFTTEVWMAPDPGVPVPYPDVEGMAGRKEALVTHLETLAGTRAMWVSKMVRLLGHIYLKKPHFQEVDSETFMFFSPIRRAWSARGAERVHDGGTRRAPSVETPHTEAVPDSARHS